MPAMKLTNANLGEPTLNFHRRTSWIMCIESLCGLISPAASPLQVSVVTEILPVSPQQDSLDSAPSDTWFSMEPCFQPKPYHVYFRNSSVLQHGSPVSSVRVYRYFSKCVYFINQFSGRWEPPNPNLLSRRFFLKYFINVLREIF